VLTVNADNSVLGSALRAGDESNIVPYAYVNGSVSLFTSGHVALVLGSESLNYRLEANGYFFVGVPAFGFLARNYVNANVSSGVLANYSAAQPHRARVTCVPDVGSSANCP
jgi:hypothetical protein